MLFLIYIIQHNNNNNKQTTNQGYSSTMTSKIQTEKSLRITVEVIITRMGKSFKLTNETHFKTASYIYFECRGLHYYILNDESQYVIHRTNHMLKKIVFESTNDKDCSNIRTYLKCQLTEKPKNFINEFATLDKGTNVFKYEIKQFKPRTDQQKTETAQNKINKIKFLKEQKLTRYRIEAYEKFRDSMYNKSTKMTRVINLDKNIGQYKLPYGFTYMNGILSSSSIYVKDEIEFNKIIDDVIILRDTQILTMDYSTIFCNASEYYHETCRIHCEKMIKLHRDSITQAYKKSITNMIVKNTKMNSNCIDSIMEWL